MFPALVDGLTSNAFVRWNDIDGTEQQHTIGWAQMKNPVRCVEKLYRSYGGDVSRLVDLCRQMIVFEHIEDLVRCLEAITQDQHVVIERIKNRMDVKYDSAASAGYRYACVYVACVCVCGMCVLCGMCVCMWHVCLYVACVCVCVCGMCVCMWHVCVYMLHECVRVCPLSAYLFVQLCYLTHMYSHRCAF
jgi:hypothetical protein